MDALLDKILLATHLERGGAGLGELFHFNHPIYPVADWYPIVVVAVVGEVSGHFILGTLWHSVFYRAVM